MFQIYKRPERIYRIDSQARKRWNTRGYQLRQQTLLYSAPALLVIFFLPSIPQHVANPTVTLAHPRLSISLRLISCYSP